MTYDIHFRNHDAKMPRQYNYELFEKYLDTCGHHTLTHFISLAFNIITPNRPFQFSAGLFMCKTQKGAWSVKLGSRV